MFVWLVVGCHRFVDEPLPPNTAPMAAFSVYVKWWQMVEDCSGISRSLAAVRWYQVVDADDFHDYVGRDLAGYWSPVSNEIVLAGHETLDGAIVRHEMLHALVRQTGHPREYFLNKCGGVVTCDRDCVSDSGPRPRFHSRPLLSDSLRVSYQIEPSTPSAGTNDGTFMVTGFATNPTADSVFVYADRNHGAGISFLWSISGDFGGIQEQVSFVDSSLVTFAPHETKRYVFDFWIGPRNREVVFPPGDYTLRVGFGYNEAQGPLTLLP